MQGTAKNPNIFKIINILNSNADAFFKGGVCCYYRHIKKELNER